MSVQSTISSSRVAPYLYPKELEHYSHLFCNSHLTSHISLGCMLSEPGDLDTLSSCQPFLYLFPIHFHLLRYLWCICNFLCILDKCNYKIFWKIPAEPTASIRKQIFFKQIRCGKLVFRGNLVFLYTYRFSKQSWRQMLAFIERRLLEEISGSIYIEFDEVASRILCTSLVSPP